jgi:hypothetical protein
MLMRGYDSAEVCALFNAAVYPVALF